MGAWGIKKDSSWSKRRNCFSLKEIKQTDTLCNIENAKIRQLGLWHLNISSFFECSPQKIYYYCRKNGPWRTKKVLIEVLGRTTYLVLKIAVLPGFKNGSFLNNFDLVCPLFFCNLRTLRDGSSISNSRWKTQCISIN